MRRKPVVRVAEMAAVLKQLGEIKEVIQSLLKQDESEFVLHCHEDAKRIVDYLLPDLKSESDDHAKKVVNVALIMRGEM